MKTIVFDLDGTLADTSGDLIAAANACFQALGHGDMLNVAQDAGTALRGGRAMLRLGARRLGLDGAAAEALADDQYRPLLAYYGANIDRHTTLYPRVVEVLQALSADGWRLAICTNKPEGLAEDLMQRLGHRSLFHSLVGADTLPVRKPDPAPYFEAVSRAMGDPAQSVMIGDSDTDRNTARAAGVPCILVVFGPAGGDMAALQPEGLMQDYAELPGLAARLVSGSGA